MRHLISFKTSKFDPSQKSPNEANPYAGESVLEWLVQINKIRSLSDKLFGRNKMKTNDKVTELVVNYSKNSNECQDIQVEEDKYG